MAKKSVKTRKISTPRIPGFTAEAALYEKYANYLMLRTVIQTGSAVELAFWQCWGNVCCDEWGDCFTKGRHLM
jgi:hypothetical protein